MKTRNSLVSNSSVSSFIIHYKDALLIHNKKKMYLLTKEEIKLLKKNDFRLSTITHPSNFDTMYYIKNSKEASKEVSLTYAKTVSCNQDDEIYFLVKNKIPFIASVHYGHETWLYPRNSKVIYKFRNMGNEVETYHQGNSQKEVEKFITSSGNYGSWTRILVKDYIKQEEEWQIKYKESLKNEN